MARISTEKNPGLFLMAAWAVHKKYPFIRFLMIGDGDLLPRIKELCKMMGMDDLFYFPGFLIGEDLPNMLAGVDIMVNPSLRAWSETFCIANIEAMAMGIPLISFSVGGVGEYVNPPEWCQSLELHQEADGGAFVAGIGLSFESRTCIGEMTKSDVPGYEAVDNAIILNLADPGVIGEAIEYLVNNPSERDRIGRNGHRTVSNIFNTDRQMRSYKKIYRDTYRKHQRGRL